MSNMGLKYLATSTHHLSFLFDFGLPFLRSAHQADFRAGCFFFVSSRRWVKLNGRLSCLFFVLLLPFLFFTTPLYPLLFLFAFAFSK
jgi:hypothetical protein